MKKFKPLLETLRVKLKTTERYMLFMANCSRFEDGMGGSHL